MKLTRYKLLHFVLAVAVVVSPALVIAGLLLRYDEVRADDFAPYFSDEIVYWHQVNTFREAGLNGGYYTFNEAPANADFTHFGTKGLLFPATYGIAARVFGWGISSALVFNIALVMLALGIFVTTVPLTIRQLVILAVTLATFWPLILNLPLIMMEAFHASVAIILAAMFFVIIRRAHTLSFPLKIIFGLLIVVASLVKGVTLALLLLPLFLITMHRRTLVHLLLAFAQAAGLFVVAYLLFRWMSLPQSRLMRELGERISSEPTMMLAAFGQDIEKNLSLIPQGRSLEIAQRFQVIFLTIVSGLSTIRHLLQRRFEGTAFAEMLFHTLNLGPVFIANVVFYDVQIWRDYRTLLPHFLISTLLLVSYRRYWLVALLIASHLLLWPKFRQTYLERGVVPYNAVAVEAFVDDIQTHIVYDPTQTNAWCNTMLMYSSHTLNARVTAIPAGIGLSFFAELDTLTPPLKSRYVFLNKDDPAPPEYNLMLTAQTDVGDLYLNPDANCE